jgi:hypothetical protein
VKLKDFLSNELEEPFPKTRDGKLLVGEVELLRLVAEREHVSDVTKRRDGENIANTAPEELPERAEW